MASFKPWSPKADRLYHGGDYNPDQWQAYPEVLKEDLRLMQLAGANCMSVNIFGWTACEPEEGRYTFEWLDRTMDSLHSIGAKAILATPSAAKPAWMSQKYPEIRRVDKNGLRQPYMGRHNCCFSSPVYRQKTAEMAERLAKRYGQHPALLGWHVNNEFNAGECHCELCYANFRAWLKDRYKTLDALNHAWWAHFWSHTLTDWSQAEPKDWENIVQELDWKRFITDNCIAYFKNEVAPLKRITPGIPVTTNFMPFYDGLDYWKLAKEEDVVSWDSYPAWQIGDDVREASQTAFLHMTMRSVGGGKPFLLMESTPEGTNWRDVGKTKQPDMHLASSLQAVAHGSDSILYFQWRKGRGSFEQFHGAVVDHVGHEHTRVFKEVASVGAAAAKLTPVLGSGVRAEVAFLWDWNNRWAIQLARGPRNTHKDLEQDALDHYHEFWRRGIATEAVSLESDLNGYKVLVAPYMYMLPKAFADKIEAFVRQGGTLVTTYLAGTVDESSLCHLGGRPGHLRKVLGLWAEETDVLLDTDKQVLKAVAGNSLGLKGSHAVRHYADVVHLEGAKALARYGHAWYAGSPALTVNAYGKGQAYYLAGRAEQSLLSGLYAGVVRQSKLRRILPNEPPQGVEVSERCQDGERFIFLINYGKKSQSVKLGSLKAVDLISGKKVGIKLALAPLACAVLRTS